MADFEKVYSVKFNVDTAIRNLEKLDKVISRIEKNKLATKLGQVSMKMKNIRQESSKTGRALDKAFAKNRAKKKIDDIKKSADKAGKSIRRMGSGAGLKSVSQNLNRYVALPLLAIGAASMKAAVDMNKSMASVSTLLEDPTEKIYELKKGVQDLAMESGQATGELSEGLYQVISALGESAENMAQLKLASKAAVAGVSTTKDAINLLSAAGKGYNDTSEEALKRTSDLAFMTAKLGVTTFPEMAASMGKVIPLAAQFGTSQEELFATMATLTGVTGNTAEVTTQLSAVYAAFMKPSSSMDEALGKINKGNEEYNFQTAGAMLKTLGFKKSIELMNEAAGGNEEELGKIFTRKEAILGILPLVTTQSENYAMKLEAMKDASGATEEAFKRQTEGINAQGHSWEKTKQRIVVFSQRIGDRLLPVVEKLLKAAEPLVKWLENLDDASIDSAISWGKLAVQFAIGLKALQGITGLTSGIANGITQMGSAAGGATGKFGGMAGKVEGLNSALLALSAGVAVGGVIWNLLDEAGEKKIKRKNEGTEASKIAAEIARNKNSSHKDIDSAIKGLENKYQKKIDAGSIVKGMGSGKAYLEEQKKLQGKKGAEGFRGWNQDEIDEVDSDLLTLKYLKAKRANKFKKQASTPMHRFPGEEFETVVPFDQVADVTMSNPSSGKGGVTVTQNNTFTAVKDAEGVRKVMDKNFNDFEKTIKRAFEAK